MKEDGIRVCVCVCAFRRSDSSRSSGSEDPFERFVGEHFRISRQMLTNCTMLCHIMCVCQFVVHINHTNCYHRKCQRRLLFSALCDDNHTRPNVSSDMHLAI